MGETKYTPISVADAVEAVRKGHPIEDREIADFRELLEALSADPQARENPLRLSSCRILKCDCSRMEITNPIVFRPTEPSTFTQKADFSQVTLVHLANLAEGTFTQGADFEQATFTHEADFGLATFTQGASFFIATFAKGARFYGALLSGALNLRDAQFRGPLDLDEMARWPGGLIHLTIDQIGKHQRRPWPTRWPGRHGRWRRLYRMILEGRKRIRHNWPSVHLIARETWEDKDELARAAEQYNMLRDNFRQLPSADEEEDRCHYKYQDLTRRASGWGPIRRFIDWGLYKWCLGYGIYTKRIILFAFCLLLAFAGIYHVADHWDMFDYMGGQGTGDFNPIYFSIITFTTIGYGDWAPRGWIRYVAGVEGLLGVTLMAFLTVSFARKLIR